MHPRHAAAAMLALGAAGAAPAATLHDEAVTGDAGGSFVAPLALPPGPFAVLGTLDGGAGAAPGDGPDEQDTFTFAVAPRTLGTLQVLASGRGTVRAFLFDAAAAAPSLLVVMTAGTAEARQLHPLGPGDYGLAVLPSGSAGTARYALSLAVRDIAPVPVPAALPLLAAGLCALGAGARRRGPAGRGRPSDRAAPEAPSPSGAGRVREPASTAASRDPPQEPRR